MPDTLQAVQAQKEEDPDDLPQFFAREGQTIELEASDSEEALS